MNSTNFREVARQESKSVTIQYDQSDQVWIIQKTKILPNTRETEEFWFCLILKQWLLIFFKKYN